MGFLVCHIGPSISISLGIGISFGIGISCSIGINHSFGISHSIGISCGFSHIHGIAIGATMQNLGLLA